MEAVQGHGGNHVPSNVKIRVRARAHTHTQATVTLRKQYRMNEAIMSLSNDLFDPEYASQPVHVVYRMCSLSMCVRAVWILLLPPPLAHTHTHTHTNSHTHTHTHTHTHGHACSYACIHVSPTHDSDPNSRDFRTGASTPRVRELGRVFPSVALDSASRGHWGCVYWYLCVCVCVCVCVCLCVCVCCGCAYWYLWVCIQCLCARVKACVCVCV